MKEDNLVPGLPQIDDLKHQNQDLVLTKRTDEEMAQTNRQSDNFQNPDFVELAPESHRKLMETEEPLAQDRLPSIDSKPKVDINENLL